MSIPILSNGKIKFAKPHKNAPKKQKRHPLRLALRFCLYCLTAPENILYRRQNGGKS